MTSNRSQQMQDFPVLPPPVHATTFLVLLGGVVPFLVLAGVLWFRQMDLDGLVRLWPAIVMVVLALGFSLLAMQRRSVNMVGGVLDVRAALFRERTPIADIDLARARVVDLAEHKMLSPVLKTWGMSLPGFHAGRFRLRGKLAKAFCLITDRRRVLWLPLQNGNDQLLLSLERPQALLDSLHAATGGRPRPA